MFMNDEAFWHAGPADRYKKMRIWIEEKIRKYQP